MQQKGVNYYGIRQELGIRSVQGKVEEQVLSWVGHAARMGEERLAKVASQGWMKVDAPPKGRRGATGGGPQMVTALVQPWRLPLKTSESTCEHYIARNRTTEHAVHLGEQMVSQVSRIV